MMTDEYEQNPSLTTAFALRRCGTDKGDPAVTMTILKEELFIVYSGLIDIHGCATNYRHKRTVVVENMDDPKDIASCSVNNILYVLNAVSDSSAMQILQIDASDAKVVNKWNVTCQYGRISVNDGLVVLSLVCGEMLRMRGIRVYDFHGSLIHQMNLDSHATNRVWLWQALKTHYDCFICLSGIQRNRVDILIMECENRVVNSLKMELERSSSCYDDDDEDDDIDGYDDDTDSCYSFSNSFHLIVDKNGNAIVSDRDSNLIWLINSSLDRQRRLISSGNLLQRPKQILFDESSGRLLVITVKETVQVFQIRRN